MSNGTYAFLAVHGTATMRFDATEAEVHGVLDGYHGIAGNNPDTAFREAMREQVRTGFLDQHHLDPVKSQPIASATIWLCLTAAPHQINPASRGFILQISTKSDGSNNFRFMAADDHVMVDQMTAKLREGRKYVVTVTPEQAAKAAQRKRTPPPRDPSLEPPTKPRPERWIPALEVMEKIYGKPAFTDVRECLEVGAMFVWKSRQLADSAQEDIDASLGAMAEFDRLHLPYPWLWCETRDYLDVMVDDAPSKRVAARFGIAAVEAQDGATTLWGFADVEGTILMSSLKATVDKTDLIAGKRRLVLGRPANAVASKPWDEPTERRIAQACGDRLLELLFLLSTRGVARSTVRVSGGKPAKKQVSGQRRMSARDYTVIRVPLVYVPDPASPHSEDGRSTGRWVRPHCRKAHWWGRFTRPLDEQHYREAVLVGANRVTGDDEVRRPSYKVT